MSPLLARDGSTCTGVINICTDVSQLNLLKRRIDILSNLAICAARAQSVEGVCHTIVAAAKSADLPWLAVYTPDEANKKSDHDVTDELNGVGRARSLGRHKSKRTTYRLVATSFDDDLVANVEAEDDEAPLTTTGSTIMENRFVEGTSKREFPSWLPALPPNVQLTPAPRARQSVDEDALEPATPETDTSGRSGSTEDDSAWPFQDLSAEHPHLLFLTPSDTSPVSESIVFAITTQSTATGRRKVLGILVAGLNEHRKLDNEYLQFFQGVGQQLEMGLLNGTAREEDRWAAEALKRLN